MIHDPLKAFYNIPNLRMRYVAAYLLATLGGKANPSKDDITKILESVGLEIEDDKLDKVRGQKFSSTFQFLCLP